VLGSEKDKSEEGKSERDKSVESLSRIHTFNLRNNPVVREKAVKDKKKGLMIDIGMA